MPKKKSHSLLLKKDILEKLFCVIVLLILSGSILNIITSGGNQVESSELNPIKIILFISYFISFFLIIYRKNTLKSSIKSLFYNKAWTLFIIFVGLSILWSINILQSTISYGAFIGPIIFGIYFATRFNQREQLNLLTYALAIALIISFIMGLYFPSQSITPEGSWQGAYPHENTFGIITSLGLIIFILNLQRKRKIFSFFLLIMILLSLIAIFLSTSKTALLVISITLLSALVLYTIWRLPKKIKLAFIMLVFLIALLGSALITINYEKSLETLGKEKTFTGRTEIWATSIENIKQKPLLGYGYGVFWEEFENNRQKFKEKKFLLTIPVHAHNGFLEILLNTGTIGLIIFLIAYLLLIKKCLNYGKMKKHLIYLWPIVFIIFLTTLNMPESTLIKKNSIFLAIFASMIINSYNLAKNAKKK